MPLEYEAIEISYEEIKKKKTTVKNLKPDLIKPLDLISVYIDHGKMILWGWNKSNPERGKILQHKLSAQFLQQKWKKKGFLK